MPDVKTRMLFISHAWKDNEHYWTIVKWFNEEPDFSWRNCSVPSHDGLVDNTNKGLEAEMTRQISTAHGVILIGAMYVAYSRWMDYEIDEAVRMSKVIIGIRPWSLETVPIKLQDASDRILYWNRASLIRAVRELT
jgi:hypothetical protein